MPGGASRTAIRLPFCSQCEISAVCTAFHRFRSMVPSALVAAVIRSGTITIVTSSATARPLMPLRADSEPANLRPVTGTGIGRGLLERVAARA